MLRARALRAPVFLRFWARKTEVIILPLCSGDLKRCKCTHGGKILVGGKTGTNKIFRMIDCQSQEGNFYVNVIYYILFTGEQHKTCAEKPEKH